MSSDTSVAETDPRPDAPVFRLPNGRDLQRRREAVGLSPEEVAAVVDVSPSTVRGWEKGNNPSVRNLRKLLAVLRNPPEHIPVAEDDEDDSARVDVPPAEELPDLIDPEFLETHGTDDIAEALERAEEEAVDTSDHPRCPACLSVRWWPKAPQYRRPNQAIADDYRCTHCSEHFDERAPSEEEVDREIATVLRLAETGVCSACRDTAELYVYDAATGAGGYVCFDHVGDLLAGGEVE